MTSCSVTKFKGDSHIHLLIPRVTLNPIRNLVAKFKIPSGFQFSALIFWSVLLTSGMYISIKVDGSGVIVPMQYPSIACIHISNFIYNFRCLHPEPESHKLKVTVSNPHRECHFTALCANSILLTSYTVSYYENFQTMIFECFIYTSIYVDLGEIYLLLAKFRI